MVVWWVVLGVGVEGVFLLWCWWLVYWYRGLGVLEGYCCFCVVECFLEGRGDFEFVVELVDGDEGGETLASFFGGGLEFFRSEAPFDVEESNCVGVTEDGGAEA